ncbi:MAG: TIGR01777 family oxidoreductase [Acidimicrobiales bacterium]
MHVVIAGSSGLIGTALTTALTHAGHRVTRLVRRPAQNPAERTWDPAGGTIEHGALDGVDAVVNLAGAGIGDKRWSDERKRELVDSRIGTTDLLARTIAAADTPPAVFLSGSAIGFYGERGDQVLTEQSAAGEGFLADLCRRWEAATEPAAAAGVRAAHLRTGLVVSSKGGAMGKMLPLFKFGLGGRMGSGRDYWSWIHLADEVAAIAFLLDNPVHGAVNLTAPNPVTNAEFTKELGRALRRPTLLPVPAFGPKLLLGPELAEALLFCSARVVPDALSTAGYRFRHPDLAGALAAVARGDDSVVLPAAAQR